MMYTHTKFAHLDFRNKIMIGKLKFFTQIEHPLLLEIHFKPISRTEISDFSGGAL